jgi:hypothetical protein
MSDADKSKLEPWHRRYGRFELLRPWFWIAVVCVYVVTFLLVTALMFVLGWIVPHLPWISKPYVNPDPPPLVTAFYCANFVLGFIMVVVPILFIFGPRRQVPALRPKRHENKPKA